MAEAAIGAAAATIAVGLRFMLPLKPDQLPTATVIVMLPVVTTFIGLRAGIVTAFLGGLASWYLFYNPFSWSLGHQAWVLLLGYLVIAVVILTTSHLYRASERQHHETKIAQLEAEAETAVLFARELAHRLGNTLAIVQSIALQTIGRDSPESAKLAGRLQALAIANRLLTEHIDMPTANIRTVIETALTPFQNGREIFRIECPDATIKAQQVVSLALALHELATNALKYGALSIPGGLVALIVTDADDHLHLAWKERNGPSVNPPERYGFGSRLLLRAGSGTELEFESDGLRCAMRVQKAVA